MIFYSKKFPYSGEHPLNIYNSVAEIEREYSFESIEPFKKSKNDSL